MALKLYFDLISQPARAIYMFLKVANIEFQPCPVKLRRGNIIFIFTTDIIPLYTYVLKYTIIKTILRV